MVVISALHVDEHSGTRLSVLAIKIKELFATARPGASHLPLKNNSEEALSKLHPQIDLNVCNFLRTVHYISKTTRPS